MHLYVKTPDEVFIEAIKTIHQYGEQTSPRGQITKEICNMSFTVREPWQIPLQVEGRNLKHFIGAIEALQLIGQTSKPEQIIAGAKAFAQFTDHGILHGAYGIRVYGKLQDIVDVLTKDPDSRQAVLTLFNSHMDLNVQTKDVPCTLALQFLIRDNKLCARTTMRSNDVWLGLPYDLIQFCAMQAAIAKALGLEMGWYSHSVGSLHLYEKHFEESRTCELVEEPQSEEYRSLWSGETIGEISSTCRMILDNPNYVNTTETTLFEQWLSSTIHEGK